VISQKNKEILQATAEMEREIENIKDKIEKIEECKLTAVSSCFLISHRKTLCIKYVLPATS